MRQSYYSQWTYSLSSPATCQVINNDSARVHCRVNDKSLTWRADSGHLTLHVSAESLSDVVSFRARWVCFDFKLNLFNLTPSRK